MRRVIVVVVVVGLALMSGGAAVLAVNGGDTVTLLTYDSFALPEAAAAAFEERTGARIEVVATGDSGAMLTGALLSAGDPEGDVIFGIDDTSATRALSEDLLVPIDALA